MSDFAGKLSLEEQIKSVKKFIDDIKANRHSVESWLNSVQTEEERNALIFELQRQWLGYARFHAEKMAMEDKEMKEISVDIDGNDTSTSHTANLCDNNTPTRLSKHDTVHRALSRSLKIPWASGENNSACTSKCTTTHCARYDANDKNVGDGNAPVNDFDNEDVTNVPITSSVVVKSFANGDVQGEAADDNFESLFDEKFFIYKRQFADRKDECDKEKNPLEFILHKLPGLILEKATDVNLPSDHSEETDVTTRVDEIVMLSKGDEQATRIPFVNTTINRREKILNERRVAEREIRFVHEHTRTYRLETVLHVDEDGLMEWAECVVNQRKKAKSDSKNQEASFSLIERQFDPWRKFGDEKRGLISVPTARDNSEQYYVSPHATPDLNFGFVSQQPDQRLHEWKNENNFKKYSKAEISRFPQKVIENKDQQQHVRWTTNQPLEIASEQKSTKHCELYQYQTYEDRTAAYQEDSNLLPLFVTPESHFDTSDESFTYVMESDDTIASDKDIISVTSLHEMTTESYNGKTNNKAISAETLPEPKVAKEVKNLLDVQSIDKEKLVVYDSTKFMPSMDVIARHTLHSFRPFQKSEGTARENSSRSNTLTSFDNNNARIISDFAADYSLYESDSEIAHSTGCATAVGNPMYEPVQAREFDEYWNSIQEVLTHDSDTTQYTKSKPLTKSFEEILDLRIKSDMDMLSLIEEAPEDLIQKEEEDEQFARDDDPLAFRAIREMQKICITDEEKVAKSHYKKNLSNSIATNYNSHKFVEEKFWQNVVFKLSQEIVKNVININNKKKQLTQNQQRQDISAVQAAEKISTRINTHIEPIIKKLKLIFPKSGWSTIGRRYAKSSKDSDNNHEGWQVVSETRTPWARRPKRLESLLIERMLFEFTRSSVILNKVETIENNELGKKKLEKFWSVSSDKHLADVINHKNVEYNFDEKYIDLLYYSSDMEEIPLTAQQIYKNWSENKLQELSAKKSRDLKQSNINIKMLKPRIPGMSSLIRSDDLLQIPIKPPRKFSEDSTKLISQSVGEQRSKLLMDSVDMKVQTSREAFQQTDKFPINLNISQLCNCNVTESKTSLGHISGDNSSLCSDKTELSVWEINSNCTEFYETKLDEWKKIEKQTSQSLSMLDDVTMPEVISLLKRSANLPEHSLNTDQSNSVRQHLQSARQSKLRRLAKRTLEIRNFFSKLFYMIPQNYDRTSVF